MLKVKTLSARGSEQCVLACTGFFLAGLFPFFPHCVKWLNVVFCLLMTGAFVLAFCGYLSYFPSVSSHHSQLA